MFLIVALVIPFSGNRAFAAFGDYAVTGGGVAGGLPAVGAASVLLNTITLDSTGSADAFDDVEYIRVSINTVDFPSTIFDTSVEIAPVDGDCFASPGAPVTYSGNNTIATIRLFLGAGPDCGDGDTITIDDLAVATNFSNNSVDSSGLVNVAIANDAVVFTDDILTTSTTLETVAAGTLTATNVQPNTLQRAASVIVTVSFTNPGSVSIANDDKIVVTFPVGFNVAGATGGTCSSMDGTFVATAVAGQVVTLERNADGTAEAPAAETCTINGIFNPTTTGATADYEIAVTTNANAVRYEDTAVAGDTITGSGGGGSGGGGNPGSGGSGDGGTPGSAGTTQETTEDDSTQETTEDDSTQETSEDDDMMEEDEMTEEEMDEEEMLMEEAKNMSDEDSAAAANTTSFDDIAGHWATGYITFLYDLGVVGGRTETSFDPNSEMTRAEIVKVALLTFGYAVDEGAVPSFTDVSVSDWYAPYLAAAESAGIVEGYENGTFGPNSSVNRAEALKILLTAGGFSVGPATVAGPFEDVPDGAWFAPYVDFAYANGIVKGKTTTMFAPGDNITRAEMSKIAVKAYGLDR